MGAQGCSWAAESLVNITSLGAERPHLFVAVRGRPGEQATERAETMENFEFVSPTHFVFGRGVEKQVGAKRLAERGARRVLLHYGGQSAIASGLIDRVKHRSTRRASSTPSWAACVRTPRSAWCGRASRCAREQDVDWVLAVGGGSVIDGKGHRRGRALRRRRVGLLRDEAPDQRRAAHRRGAHHPGRRQRGVEEHRGEQRRAGPEVGLSQQCAASGARVHEPGVHFHAFRVPDGGGSDRHVLSPAGALLRRRGRRAGDGTTSTCR